MKRIFELLPFIAFVCLYFISFSVMAQEVAVPIADQILAFADKIPLDGMVLTFAVVLLEVILRAVKTDKPRSILYIISTILKAVATLFEKIAEFMDKLLQRLNK